jgi:hypothetical protein
MSVTWLSHYADSDVPVKALQEWGKKGEFNIRVCFFTTDGGGL